jgi:hypothetical protein
LKKYFVCQQIKFLITASAGDLSTGVALGELLCKLLPDYLSPNINKQITNSE